MHATQPQGGTGPEPHHIQDDGAAQQIVNLLTDPDRFRAQIAAQVTAQLGVSPAEPDTAGDDGYVVTETGLRALDEASAAGAPGTAGSVLRSAALYLQRHGWFQGSYYDATPGSFTPPACLVGAIGMVCYGGPVDAPAQHFDDPGFLDFEEAVLHLDRYLMVNDGSESYEFNDAKGRTAADVLHVLRQAADTPTDELIDAICAIDATNAEVAVLVDLLKPCGIWGTATDSAQPVEHVDYPHTSGTLYDCPACEAECFCADGFQCVHCALEAEQNPGSGVGGGDGE